MARQSACIGLVGGLGVGATVHYYQRLTAAFAAREATLRLVMAHAEVSRVLALVRDKDLQGLAGYMAGHIEMVMSAGADFWTIGAVTPYICARELRSVVSHPGIDVVDLIVAETKRRDVKRIGIFGSNITMQTAVFGRLPHLTVVTPAEQDQQFVAASYGRLAATGDAGEVNIERLRSVAHALVRGQGADAIVLAGTELALVFEESSAGFPVIDGAKLHIDAIVERAIASQT